MLERYAPLKTALNQHNAAAIQLNSIDSNKRWDQSHEMKLCPFITGETGCIKFTNTTLILKTQTFLATQCDLVHWSPTACLNLSSPKCITTATSLYTSSWIEVETLFYLLVRIQYDRGQILNKLLHHLLLLSEAQNVESLVNKTHVLLVVD